MVSTTTVIEVSDYGAKNFLIYQKHKKFFDLLIDKQVHKMNNGNVILSFDSNGDCGKIKFEQVVFKQ